MRTTAKTIMTAVMTGTMRNIREWLKIRGFKQVDLARALGKQKYQISRYLSDGVSSYDTIKKIAEFLEVDTEQLILK